MQNPQDRYNWKAGYSDGTELCQVQADGKKNAYADIDRSKLTSFGLFREGTADKSLVIGLHGGQDVLWRRRTDIINGEVVHIVAIRTEGKVTEVIALHADGTVEQKDGFEDGHAWLYPVEIHENEGE